MLGRYEAHGNDFAIALMTEPQLREFDAALGGLGLTRSDVARAVCDRADGVGNRAGYVHSKGADGFIVGVHHADGSVPAGCVRMHLLNADGSFAETSGNGAACLVAAAADAGVVREGAVDCKTDAGVQRCEVGPANISSKTRPSSDHARAVRMSMNRVCAGPEIPAGLMRRIHDDFGTDLAHVGTGSVGNPHLVIALARPPIARLGGESNISAAALGSAEPDSYSARSADTAPTIDADALGDRVAELGCAYEGYFPDGINVEFIWPSSRSGQGQDSPTPSQDPDWRADALTMSVWERGAGHTVACGSGAVVAATLAHRWGFVRSAQDRRAARRPDHGHERVDVAPSMDAIVMQTAPFPRCEELPFEYRVRTACVSHDNERSPELLLVAERIETDIPLRLSEACSTAEFIDAAAARR